MDDSEIPSFDNFLGFLEIWRMAASLWGILGVFESWLASSGIFFLDATSSKETKGNLWHDIWFDGGLGKKR